MIREHNHWEIGPGVVIRMLSPSRSSTKVMTSSRSISLVHLIRSSSRDEAEVLMSGKVTPSLIWIRLLLVVLGLNGRKRCSRMFFLR